LRAALLLLLAGCFPEVSISKPGAGSSCTWYVDDDGDGYGEAATSVEGPCDAVPSGTSGRDGDCDDAAADVSPAGIETCDGRDEDCDGQVDEDAGAEWFVDADGDGFGDADSATVACTAPPGTTGVGGDCDDGDAGVSPEATELWYDGVDQDCDGGSDDDADQDGYDADFQGGLDCDDGDAGVSPEAAELWYDGVDQDCDGGSDDDADQDGFDADFEGGLDCDDGDASVFPGGHATEVPGDGLDADCDGIDACVDLSCDGRPDLVFPGYEDPAGAFADTLLYFSVADGTDPALHAWDAAASVALDAGAVSQALVEDFDGDGYLDIVLAVHHDATGEATNSWIYRGGAGGYTDVDRVPVATEGARAVCSGDWDGDGVLDLFFAGESDDEAVDAVGVLLQDPLGSAVRAELPLGASRSCVFADVDGDGAAELYAGARPDFAGQLHHDAGAVRVVSDGSGGASLVSLKGDRVRRILSTDLDADGSLEIVLVDQGKPWDLDKAKTRILRWDGSEHKKWDDLSAIGGVDAATCDADGDGLTDLVVLSGTDVDGGLESTETLAWLNQGGRDLASGGVTPAADTVGATRLTAADLTGDGTPELVTSNFEDASGSHEHFLRLFDVTGSGRISLSGSRDLPVDGGRGHAVADLDGDGDLDIVTSAWTDDAGSGRVDSRVYWNAGSATMSNAFSTGGRTNLETTAIWGDPVVVP